jgi:hypothetical protein
MFTPRHGTEEIPSLKMTMAPRFAVINLRISRPQLHYVTVR